MYHDSPCLPTLFSALAQFELSDKVNTGQVSHQYTRVTSFSVFQLSSSLLSLSFREKAKTDQGEPSHENI